jgi:lambda family phage tail tape measure protein
MAAGSIVIDLLMRTGAFSTDAKRAEKEIKQLGENIKKFATVATTATLAAATGFAYMAKQSINAMDEMGDMAQSLGVTVEQISRLGRVAEVEGFKLDEFGGIMSKLIKTLADARSGAEGAGDVFKAMGLDPKAFKDSEDALLQISEKFAGYQDGLEKTALAQELFGKSGAKFMAFLNQGAEGIQKVADELAIFGNVSTESARQSGEFNDSLAKIGIVGGSLMQKFASEMLPVLNNFTNGLLDAFKNSELLRKDIEKLIAVDAVRWAENLGIALAHVVDSAIFVARAVLAISSSFRVVYNDIALAMQAISPKAVTDTMSWWEGLKQSKKERDDIVRQADELYSDLINKNAAFYTELAKQSVSDARLLRLNLPDEFDDSGAATGRKPPAPGVPGKAGSKEVDKLANMLAEAKKLGAEYEREREHSLEMLKIRDDLVGMTENERRIQETVNEVLNATSKALEQVADKREAAAGRGASAEVLAEYDAQIEKIKEVGAAYELLARAQETSAIAAQRTFSFGWNTALSQFAEDASNSAKVASDMFSSLTSNLSNAISNFVESGKLSFGDLTKSIIKDLIRIQLQAQVSRVFGMIASGIGNAIGGAFSSGATTIGAGTTAGGAGAVAYPINFSEGGYTGAGGKYEPAGIVHKGEYVLNADSTKRIGKSRLDMLNGFANGGYVGTSPSGGSAMGGNVTINIKNEAGGDGYQATAQARRNEGGLDIDILVKRVVANDLRNNGGLAQQMASTFNLRRSA